MYSPKKGRIYEYMKVEFDVNFNCRGCVIAVESALLKVRGIKSIDIDMEGQRIIVESSQPCQVIKETIESTGKKAVLKGYGTTGLECAAAEVKGKDGVYGVVRFLQKHTNICVIDGTIDGLKPGHHGIHIHEFGDISEGFASLGTHYNPSNFKHGGPFDKERHYGDLGNITADDFGRASFILEDRLVKVWEIIGRSIAVTSNADDFGRGSSEASKVNGNSGNILACGIIARSSGISENPKRICQCDGVSVWDANVPGSVGPLIAKLKAEKFAQYKAEKEAASKQQK